MTIKEVFENFGLEVTRELQKNIDTRGNIKSSTGMNATRRLRQSIDYKVFNLGGDTRFFLGFIGDAEGYASAADTGRPKGKMPPIEDIKKWVVARGLREKLTAKQNKRLRTLKNKTVRKSLRQITVEQKITKAAWGIAKHIGENGTKPTNFWSDVVTEDRKRDLLKDLAKAAKDQIKNDFRSK
jgi:hypothetical protein